MKKQLIMTEKFKAVYCTITLLIISCALSLGASNRNIVYHKFVQETFGSSVVTNKYGEAVETIELEPATAETFDYEISNIKYDYTVSLDNGKCDIRGDFSFDVSVDHVSEFIIAHTNPESLVKDFYSAHTIFEANPDGQTVKHYVRPYTRPETLFKLMIRKDDNSFFSSHAICTTDYLREEDKVMFFSGISLKNVMDDMAICIENSTLKVTSGFDLQQISLIDINGKEIMHINLCDLRKCEISLADISKGFYIVRIKDVDGRIYNRKIIY